DRHPLLVVEREAFAEQTGIHPAGVRRDVPRAVRRRPSHDGKDRDESCPSDVGHFGLRAISSARTYTPSGRHRPTGPAKGFSPSWWTPARRSSHLTERSERCCTAGDRTRSSHWNQSTDSCAFRIRSGWAK